MRRKTTIITSAILVLVWTLAPCALGRCRIKSDRWNLLRKSASIIREDCIAVHNIGKIVLGTHHAWSFGGYSGPYLDCYTGEYPPERMSEYPKGSCVSYLDAGFYWVGGIVDGDTLVSQSDVIEFWTEERPQFRSIIDPSSRAFEGAVSEQDYIAVASDTFPWPFDWTFGGPANDKRPHKPLNLYLTKRSYAWSYEYAEDFVLFDIEIKNMGTERINDAYFGIQVCPWVGFNGNSEPTYLDDIGGFLEAFPSAYGCGLVDTLNIMWGADNDGDPINGAFADRAVWVAGNRVKSAPDVTGVFLLGYPTNPWFDRTKLSYNWWYDWWP